VAITWLHLSDLHRGQPGDIRWARGKDAFLKDLEDRASLIGKPDLVFFTGDLAFSGHKDQYELIDQTIEEVRSVLGDFVIVPVPGNHDLARPHKSDLSAIACERYFDTDTRCRDGIRNGLPTSVEFFKRLFAAYEDWFNKRVFPSWTTSMQDHQLGLLPGDFVASYSKDDLKLGIAGLNSAFLDLTDNRDGHLAIESEQLAAKINPSAWRMKHDVCLLLMHHPWSSLHPTARTVLHQEIYPPDEFLACFCGHEHQPAGTQEVFPDGGTRRLIQASSLFGLEQWGNHEDRRSGYAWGKLERSGNDEVTLRRWPRRAELVESRSWAMGAVTGSDPAKVTVALKKKSQ
jgi:3',5'-cyclic AMP phosphodiesterase CpdA